MAAVNARLMCPANLKCLKIKILRVIVDLRTVMLMLAADLFVWTTAGNVSIQ